MLAFGALLVGGAALNNAITAAGRRRRRRRKRRRKRSLADGFLATLVIGNWRASTALPLLYMGLKAIGFQSPTNTLE